MTEAEYIDTANLARLRAAQETLHGVRPVALVDREALLTTRRALSGMIGRLEVAVADALRAEEAP